VGLQLDVRKRVEDLVLHEKQMLLIARAISRNARYLILDEPTTALGQHEIERLFAFIRDVKGRAGVIYISHRLGEVREIADQIMVLRNGQKVAEFQSADVDTSAITEAMLGAPVNEIFPPKSRVRTPAPILAALDLNRRSKLHNIHLTAFTGEVLGIAGLVGAGKTELLRALAGADQVDSGEIQLDGRIVRYKTPATAVQNGIFLVPEERRSQGVLIDETVQGNLSLPFLDHFSRLLGLMHRVRERSHAETMIGRLNLIPPEPQKKLHDLSGGNQQKVAIGKWFGAMPRVMLFDEPTQGIDVGAKRDVYALIRELAQTSAVIFASSDIDEVLGIADRVLVMRDGSIVAQLTAEAFDRARVLEYAMGTRSIEAETELSWQA
jgi:simple sugar transport system ATP-binding protein